jgi:D-glycero-D-manno-heptose 1,7-bisphosphate phosphatase
MARPAIFLDRDGVINRTIFRDGKARAPDRVEDFEFFPGVEAAVENLRAAGYLIVVVTNQPDVARGWQKRENVEAMNDLVRTRLNPDALKACFHDAVHACECRKPKPGMLNEAARELGIDFARSYMIGDRAGDLQAGRAAGCRTNLYIEPILPAGETIDDPTNIIADARFTSLADAAKWILAQASAE